MLDVIAPPYTTEFVHLFLPLIENDGITGTLRTEDGNDPVSEFICKSHSYTGFIGPIKKCDQARRAVGLTLSSL